MLRKNFFILVFLIICFASLSRGFHTKCIKGYLYEFNVKEVKYVKKPKIEGYPDVCCEGYSNSYDKDYKCQSLCSEDCGENAYCSKAHICVCDRGAERDANGVCKPICGLDCVNGFCASDDTCDCDDGLELMDETNCEVNSFRRSFCEEICTNGICVNSYCQCMTGYQSVHGMFCRKIGRMGKKA